MGHGNLLGRHAVLNPAVALRDEMGFDILQLDLVTNMPPMREVVSGFGSNTEGLSKVVTHYINPINRKQPSYTRHILAEVQDINRTLSPLPSITRLVDPATE